MKGCLEKTIPLNCPPELRTAAAGVETYPTSIRQANGLYEVTMPLLRENGLIVPRLRYEAWLHFVPDKQREAFIKYGKQFPSCDMLQVRTRTDDKETCVEVVRNRGARITRNKQKNPLSIFWYDGFSDFLDAMFGLYPAFTYVLRQDGSFFSYNLESDKIIYESSEHS